MLAQKKTTTKNETNGVFYSMNDRGSSISRLMALFLGALMIFSITVYAQATPTGPDTLGATDPPERRDKGAGAAETIPAQAGNITELAISDNKTTTVWQGYFGNVTSNIVLQDANNASFYEWAIVDPSGEVFAANDSVSDWATVRCGNLTNTGDDTSEYHENETLLENFFNITSGQNDGFGETFTGEYSGGDIQVGSNTISSTDNCPQTYTYVDNASQSTDYLELLLVTDNRTLVFTTILEPSGTTGFDSLDHHFQMIVAEDGLVAGGTNYYFYVELE